MNIERIREVREDLDLTQYKLASKLNISQVQYHRYESGIREIPIHLLVKIAEIFNTNIEYLIGLTDERKPLPKSKFYDKQKKSNYIVKI